MTTEQEIESGQKKGGTGRATLSAGPKNLYYRKNRLEINPIACLPLILRDFFYQHEKAETGISSVTHAPFVLTLSKIPQQSAIREKMKFQYLIFLVFTVFGQMHTHHGAARLIKKLLVTNKYNNNIRPVYNVSFGSKIKLEFKYGVIRIKIMIFRAVIKQSCSC